MATPAPLAQAGAEATWNEALAAAGRISGLMGIALDIAVRTSFLPDAQRERWRARARTLQRAASELCDLHAVRTRVAGALPEPPFVLVANHVSYLDPIVLGALTPCTAVAKREIGAWPIIGSRTRELGVLLVDRRSPYSGARALRGALRALEHGVPVLNFPEGSTTRGDELLPFRTGIFGAARLAGVPIVPAAVTYDDPELCWAGDDTFLPHYLRLSCRREVFVSIAYGAPLRADGPPAELAARARSAIVNLLFG